MPVELGCIDSLFWSFFFVVVETVVCKQQQQQKKKRRYLFQLKSTIECLRLKKKNGRTASFNNNNNQRKMWFSGVSKGLLILEVETLFSRNEAGEKENFP